MTDNAHIPEETLALYALLALDAAESAAIRAHLAECEACRTELARAEGDLALVAMSVEQHPLPEGARARFLSRIGATQEGDGSAQTPAAVSPGMSTSALPAAPIVLPLAPRRAAGQPAWLAAAAMLLVSIGLGIEVHNLTRQLDATLQQLARQTVESRHAQQVLNLLTAPAAQHVMLTTGKTPPAPSARAVYLASRGALMLEASNLKPLPAGKTYELWIIPSNGAEPIAAGLFGPDAAGSASVVLPPIPAGVTAKAFGVTIENTGGAVAPTLPIILAGAAPSAGE